MDVFELIAAGDVDGIRELLAGDPAQAAAHDAEGVSALLRARYHWNDDLVAAIRAADPPLDEFDAAAFGALEHRATRRPGPATASRLSISRPSSARPRPRAC